MNVIPAANDLSSTASGRVRELVSQADRDSVPPQHHDLVADSENAYPRVKTNTLEVLVFSVFAGKI